LLPHGIGDLISYHSDEKGRTVMGKKGRESLSEYSEAYIDMRADNLLISADSGVGRPSTYACGGTPITRFGAAPGGHLGEQDADRRQVRARAS
jgi:hypothetical protein